MVVLQNPEWVSRVSEWISHLPEAFPSIIELARSIHNVFEQPLVNTFLLFVIVFWLRREGRRLANVVYEMRTLNQKVTAFRTDIETAPSSENGSNGPAANWEGMRTLWDDLRDRIELKVEQLDGRVRRKYENIPRRSYNDVIVQLAKDCAINEQTATNLVEMNNIFMSYRNRRLQTPKEMAERFARLSQIPQKELAGRSIYD